MRRTSFNSQDAVFRHCALAMQNDADTFRRYAAVCRRLAERASEEDKALLMEIAGAWTACAEEKDEEVEQGQDTESRPRKRS